jgi:hypothetical protein
LTETGAVCAAVFGGIGAPAGTPCNFVNDCEPGAGCFGTGPGICLTYCDIQRCPPDPVGGWQPCPAYCSGSDVCQGIVGQDAVGACVRGGF